MRSLESVGVLGAHPVAWTGAVWHGVDRTHVVARYWNWTRISAKTGALAAEPVSRETLRLVPSDATLCSLQRLDPRTVLNNDCLAPEGYGEIIGGSQREDDYEKLLARIRDQGLDPEAYRWYLDLRRYGTFVHSGFGLGVERTVAWICGLAHIREAIAFPRQIHRLYP